MHSSHGGSRAQQRATNLHQATGIDGDYRVGSGFQDRIDFRPHHAARHRREFHGKRSAEAAALFRGLHFRQFQPLHISEKAARRFLDLEFTQSMTTVMKSDLAVESRPNIVNTENVREKLRKLVRAFLDLMSLLEQCRLVAKQIVKMMGDHGRTRPAGYHDILRIAEDIQEMPGYLPCLIPISAVESGLSAAGLSLAKVDFATGAFKYVRHRQSRPRKQLVNDAGDEQRNSPGHETRIVSK